MSTNNLPNAKARSNANANARLGANARLNARPNARPNTVIKSYLYLGHGKEIIELIDSTLTHKVQIVFKNCTISTLTKTGLPSKLQQVLRFNELSLKHTELLDDPVKNFNIIDTFLRGPENYKSDVLKNVVFNVHVEDEKFIDKHCGFLFEFKFFPGKVTLYKSGLYEVGSNVPQLENSNYKDLAIATIDPTGTISMEIIVEMYRDSIYPTLKTIKHTIFHLLNDEHVKFNIVPENIEENIDISAEIPYELFCRAVRISCTKTVFELMQKYPGNHYFLPCRSYQDQDDYAIIPDHKSTLGFRKNSNNRVTKKTGREKILLKDEAVSNYNSFIVYFVKKYNPQINHIDNANFIIMARMKVTHFKQLHIDFFNDLIQEINQNIKDGYFTIHDVPIIEELKHLKTRSSEILDIEPF
jgi:hypothetical protein